MTIYELMMQACIDELSKEERTKVGVDLLCRVVQCCSDTIAPPETAEKPPDMHFIRAWTIRCLDLIWQPGTERFIAVADTEIDLSLNLLHVEFSDDDEPARCYATDEVVQIPVDRARAIEWNKRHRVTTDAQGHQ